VENERPDTFGKIFADPWYRIKSVPGSKREIESYPLLKATAERLQRLFAEDGIETEITLLNQ
jgi:hypothetical protein